jgi:hypothetical protein
MAGEQAGTTEFDQAARYAARRLDPAGLLRWLLGEEFARAWEYAGWLDTQAVPFPGEKDRRCDTVFAFERRAHDWGPLAVVVEFMTEPRRVILRRLADYALRVHEDRPQQAMSPVQPYDVIGVVVTLTGVLDEREWNMRPPDCGGLGLGLTAEVRNLATVDAADCLGQIASGAWPRCLLAWVPLMRGGGEPALVAEWRRLAEAEPDEARRAEYAGLALVFTE